MARAHRVELSTGLLVLGFCCVAACGSGLMFDLPAEEVAPGPSLDCGNGTVDPGETCDGDCPAACDDGDPCTDDILTGTSESCDAVCRFDADPTCQAASLCASDTDCTAELVCAASSSFAVPRLDHAAVDGECGEFPGSSALDMAWEMGQDGQVWLAWTDVGLIVCADVVDSELSATADRDGTLWRDDSIEVWVGTDDARENFKLYVSATNVQGDASVDASGAVDTSWNASFESVVADTAAGYTIELYIPWAEMGLVPDPERAWGFDVMVNDSDVSTSTLSRSAWWDSGLEYNDPGNWGQILLLASESTGCVVPAGELCEPLTCADLSLPCGNADDGCGRTLDCGACGPVAASAACLNDPGPVQVVEGTFTARFKPSSADNERFDARDATFINNGNRSFQSVELSSAANMCWVGGTFTNAESWHPLDASWGLSKAGVSTGGRNTTTLFGENTPNVIWTGFHAYNVHDGARTVQAGDHWTIQHAWLDYVRDDCIENDRLRSGRVYDSLFDGCYVAFSARPGPNSDLSAAGQTITIDRLLVRMEPMPKPHSSVTPMQTIDGVPFGYGPVFKLGPEIPSFFEIVSSVFLIEYDTKKTQMPPPSKVTRCEDNVLIWLDPDMSAANRIQSDFPGCFTVLTGTEGKQLWKQRVADWHARHPDVGANRKPAVPGAYTWPRS